MTHETSSPTTSEDASLLAWIDNYFHASAIRLSAESTLAAYHHDLTVVTDTIATLKREPTANLTLANIQDHELLVASFDAYTRDLGSASVRRVVSVWNGFFNYLVSVGAVPGNPMAILPRPRRRPRVTVGLTDDTVAQLIDTIARPAILTPHPWPQLDLAIISTMLLTGLRPSEMCAAQIGDLVGTARHQAIVVAHDSRRPARTLPIESPLTVILAAYLAERASRFPTTDETSGSTALQLAPHRSPVPGTQRQTTHPKWTQMDRHHRLQTRRN